MSTTEARSLRVREVRFEGNAAFEPETLKKVLEELKARRVIPAVWTRKPRYEDRAVAADLARLRSFYISHGYFDARVEVGGVTVEGREAILTLNVHSGPRYSVRQLEIDGIDREVLQPVVVTGGEFPSASLCACLLDARRTYEARGHIDFAAEIDVSPADGAAASEAIGKRADVTARVRTGSQYTVGRINFSGHRRINDSTLRRAMSLQERGVFDLGRLRASLAALDSSGLFEPLTLGDVEITRKPDVLTADLKISVRERPGRHWSLSGPITPAAFATPLQATISARLPPWGRGVFEASTYYVTFSLIGFNPLVRLLPIAARPGRRLLLLERPYLPGQRLASGFEFSPQLSASSMLASYGFIHLDHAMRALLTGEPTNDTALLIPIEGPHRDSAGGRAEDARFLICNPPRPRHQWLRRVAAIAADLALNAFRPNG